MDSRLNYSVNPQERVRAIIGDDYKLTEEDYLTYEWRAGYEKLTIQHENGGGMEYQGSYHPGDGSCEGNPCWHCGKAFYEEDSTPWSE
jgi:hypothetical protein